jgi:hypothetical protein
LLGIPITSLRLAYHAGTVQPDSEGRIVEQRDPNPNLDLSKLTVQFSKSIGSGHRPWVWTFPGHRPLFQTRLFQPTNATPTAGATVAAPVSR